MYVAEALSVTDIVAKLRRMLQTNESSAGVAPMSAIGAGFRDYVYNQTGKSVR